MIVRHLLALILAVPLAAQPAALFRTWTLASAPDMTKVIEDATATMNFITRPIARSRLAKTNAVEPTIRIEPEPGGVAIQYGERQPQHLTSDGRAMEWTREDGEKLLVSARMDADDLVQVYKAADGERTNTFQVDGAGRVLTLKVTVTSPRLPGPLSYVLTYR